MNTTNLAFVRNRVCRKSGKKPHAKAQSQINNLCAFAPLREKFHAAIFLLVKVFKLPCSGVHQEVSVVVLIVNHQMLGKPALVFRPTRLSSAKMDTVTCLSFVLIPMADAPDNLQHGVY